MSAASPATRAAAKNQAVHSFAWGLLIDVTVAVVLVLSTAFTDIQWTKVYWMTLGLSLAKSVLQALVSYVARRVLPVAGFSTDSDS